jgi:hypothetical protein
VCATTSVWLCITLEDYRRPRQSCASCSSCGPGADANAFAEDDRLIGGRVQDFSHDLDRLVLFERSERDALVEIHRQEKGALRIGCGPPEDGENHEQAEQTHGSVR